MIPDIGQSQAFNRYSYVNNNPVNHTDPTGHFCDETGNCYDSRGHYYLSTILKYKGTIEGIYGWNLEGSYTSYELKIIYQAGQDILSYVNKLTNGNGAVWMQKNIGEVTLHSNSWESDVMSKINQGNTSFVFPSSDIWLAPKFETGSAGHIVHEIGHVVDNKIAANLSNDLGLATLWGGGPSDLLISYLGGSPAGVRFWFGNFELPKQYHYIYPNDVSTYGNNSYADYFAEGFRNTIYSNHLPSGVVKLWIDALIVCTQ